MNESTFISNNKHKWQELEDLLETKEKDPDKLQELFVKVSSDLSYARTFYPNRTVRLYLNGLTQRVLDLIQSRKSSFSWSMIVDFYRHELPQQLWRARRAFLVSFVVFALAVIIGALSTAYNPEFTRVILGDAYVEMTNQNINDQDPMAVYKSQGQVDMFFGITLNNIRVAFIAFVMGLLGSIGTVVLLMSNGIMLGSFQYFFYQKGLFLTSFLTIWIHGTIEISAIIIAGAAGLILGDGILHPKTYNRSLSLQVASKRAIRVLLSTVPLFVIAGFLESFITRLTDLPVIVKTSIILLSLGFIIYHFIIYPYKYQQNYDIPDDDYDVEPSDLNEIINNAGGYKSFSAISEITFAQLRAFGGQVIYRGILPVLFLATASYWAWAKIGDISNDLSYPLYSGHLLFNYEAGGHFLPIVYLLCLVHLTTIISITYKRAAITWQSYLLFLKMHGWKLALLIAPFLAVFYYAQIMLFVLMMCMIPPHFIFVMLYNLTEENLPFTVALKESLSSSYNKYFGYFGPLLLVSGIYLLFWLVNQTVADMLFTDFFSWLEFFPGNIPNSIYVDCLFRIITGGIVLMIFYFMFLNKHRSVICQDQSIDLQERIEVFGIKDKSL